MIACPGLVMCYAKQINSNTFARIMYFTRIMYSGRLSMYCAKFVLSRVALYSDTISEFYICHTTMSKYDREYL